MTKCATIAAALAPWVFASMTAQAASGQDAARFPVKPVRVLVPQGPGGGTDVQARLFAQKMSENLGQSFIVDNRSGGGAAGVTAVVAAAKAAPDGYTLLAATPSFTFSPALYKNYPVDPVKDFTPVSLLTRAPYVLVVNPSVPVKSVRELVALGRAQPGKLNFGAGGMGSGTHLVTAWLLGAAKVEATYVPYKSTGAALIDLLAGRLDASLVNVLTAVPHLNSGKLRPLGVSTAQRSKVLPNIPTVAEQGVDGYNASTFHGYVAPARAPAAIVNRLSAEYAKVVRSAEIAAKLSEDGGEPVGSSPEEFRKLIVNETQVWNAVIKAQGITTGR